MASSQVLAGLPPITLDAGCTVTFEAIDALTGAAVTGVAISAATLYATNVYTDPVPPFPVPLLTLDPSA